jgi:amidase
VVHVSPVATTFDPAVWRVVGSPLVPGAADGPLAGETVAVKDLFAVRGFATGAGVPAYLAGQAPAAEHATAVARLLAAGADVRGIAQTDQFAYSLAGDNPHFGTPVNAAVPGAFPGGSSSGSATAVALGAATIGLGTDTAGSIRIPASYQGLWGLRTTHGTVPDDGVLGLAPDFDAVGLLTRTPGLLTRAAAALIGPDSATLSHDVIDLTDAGFDLAALAAAFATRQGFQAWQLHGPWIRAHPDALRGSVAERFQLARRVTEDDATAARHALDQGRREIEKRLGTGILSLPAAASVAPRLSSSDPELQAIRTANLQLTCVAGISGRPAVCVPGSDPLDGPGPVGWCYVGPPGSDLALVGWAADRTEHGRHQPFTA